MCDQVFVKSAQGGGEWATTKDQLRVLLGGVEPVLDARYTSGDWPGDSCLCPCDLEATAKAADMTLRRGEAMDYLMAPSEGKTTMEYDISYTGVDGCEHHEAHAGDQVSLRRSMTFLEDRGAHGISVECDGAVVYQHGGFVS